MKTKEGKQLYWEREPSYLLYGGYISAKNLPDFDITDKKVLKNFISKTKVFNNLTKYISRGYYQFNGFKKRSFDDKRRKLIVKTNAKQTTIWNQETPKEQKRLQLLSRTF